MFFPSSFGRRMALEYTVARVRFGNRSRGIFKKFHNPQSIKGLGILHGAGDFGEELPFRGNLKCFWGEIHRVKERPGKSGAISFSPIMLASSEFHASLRAPVRLQSRP